MTYKGKIKLVKDAIITYPQAFSIEDNLHKNRHENNIKRGKLLLKLLSTVGTPDMLTWLSSAESDRSFYNFNQYRIVKKTSKVKDTIDIKEVGTIIDTAKKCFGMDTDPGIVSLLTTLDMKRQGYDVKKTKYLIPGLMLMLGKMVNIVNRTAYLVGEIYLKDDISKTVKGVDLIDLYMQQENIENKKSAIEELCKILKFDISEDVFDEVNIDMRTRWKYNPFCSNMDYVSSHDDCRSLEFEDGKQFLGKVYFDTKGIVAPSTIWSKNNDTPGHVLEIPFPKPYPVWNMDLIRENRNSLVVVTDSLLAIHNIYGKVVKDIKELEEDLNILKQKDERCYWGGMIGDFEQELKNKILAQLKEKHQFFETSNGTLKYEDEYNMARAVFRIKGFDFRFISDGPGQKSSPEDAEADLNRHASFSVSNQLISENNDHIKSRLEESFSKGRGYKANVNEVGFDVFKDAYWLVKEYIDQKIEDDRNRIAEIKFKLIDFKKIIFTGWYGGDETALDVNWSALRRRNIFYVIRNHKKNDYRIALKVYSCLKKYPNTNVMFIDYVKMQESSNGIYNSFIKAEDFVEQARKDYDLDYNLLRRDASSQYNPDLPDYYDPKENEDLPDDKFLLEPLFRERSISMLYSEPGVGKSWLALSIAQSLLYGTSTFLAGLGWQATKSRRVLIIDSEMSEHSFKKRLKLLSSYYMNISKYDNSKKMPTLKYKLVAHEDWDLTDDEGLWRDKITKWLNLGKKNQTDLLILDNLSTLSGFNDSGKSWRNMFNWLQWLREHNCSSLILHHANKTTGDQRGSSMKSATVDNIIRVKRALPGQRHNIAINVNVEKGRDAHGEALDPFNVMLKISGEKASWHSTLAKGTKKLSISKRNKMIIDTINIGAFNQQIIADYFGIDIHTLKGIVAKEKKQRKK